MAGVYSHFIVHLCFCVLLCSVAGENEDGRQNVTLEDDDNLNMKDVRMPQEKFTPTTQNANSGMVSSDTMKKVIGSLMYTSLSTSNRNPNLNEGQKLHSQNSVKKRQFNESGDDDDSESTTTVSNRDKGEVRDDSGVRQNGEKTPHTLEETPNNREEPPDNHGQTTHSLKETPGNLEETPNNVKKRQFDESGHDYGELPTTEWNSDEDEVRNDPRVRQNGEKAQNNLEATTNNLEETTNNPIETPNNIKETPNSLEGIQERNNLRNLTENEDLSNTTLKDDDDLTESPTSKKVTTKLPPSTPTTQGYTRQRINPNQFTPTKAKNQPAKDTTLRAEKMESRGNTRSMSVMFLWILSLCRWIL